MSVKHVKEYYKQICDQYQEMVDNIRDMEDEAEKGLIEPERVDRLREQVAPIKQNYERWAYMMFLLNQPNRKSRISRYKKQNSKILKHLEESNSLEAVLRENTEARAHIGE